MAKKRKGTLAKSLDDRTDLQLTPMIDMAFLILIFFMCLPFKTLEGKLAAYLPTDKGINPTPEEPPQDIKVSIHIMSRKEVPKVWGVAAENVTMPSEVDYKFNQRTTTDIQEVGRWIQEAKKQAQGMTGKVIGEIKAGHKVPHKFIVAVLNKFKEAEMEKVDFYGTAIPPPELRRLKYLPYPKSNYVGVAD